MDAVVGHPSVGLLDLGSRPRRKLKPRHESLFFLGGVGDGVGVGDGDGVGGGSSSSSSSNNNSSKSKTSSCANNELLRFGGETASTSPARTLFERLASACCESSVVPRKEFFETYAAALCIHENFPPGVSRVADLAAGHGLLSWMLLAMDEYGPDGAPRRREGSERGRTAVCVDARMPRSAVAIARSMRHHLLPVKEREGGGDRRSVKGELNGDQIGDDDAGLYDRRWSYVEADLRDVTIGGSSTLIASVHACGTLSDELIRAAIAGGGAPLALVPCCHTYSARKGYQPHPVYSGTTADVVGTRISSLLRQGHPGVAKGRGGKESSAHGPAAKNTKGPKRSNEAFRIIEDVIDEVRIGTLRNAGYGDVSIAVLPPEFTERNRLILAQGGGSNGKEDHPSTVPGATFVDGAAGGEQDAAVETVHPAPPAVALARKGAMPPIAAFGATHTSPATTTGRQRKAGPGLAVPLGNDPASIDACLSASGRARAARRMRDRLPNHFAPKLDVSMWLPPPTAGGGGAVITAEALQEILDEVVRFHQQNEVDSADGGHAEDRRRRVYRCTIHPINESFIHPETGRTAQTHRVEYSYADDDAGAGGGPAPPFPRHLAKDLHQSFCENIIRSFDGAELR